MEELTEDPGRIPLRFRIIAIGFSIGAIAHIAFILFPAFGAAVGPPSPVWRNALFTFIDLALAFAALTRPPIFAFALSLFLLQQLTTKGLGLLRSAGQGRINWIALVVLLFLVYSVVVVWNDYASRRSIASQTEGT